jgi:hypothetical protein
MFHKDADRKVDAAVGFKLASPVRKKPLFIFFSISFSILIENLSDQFLCSCQRFS